LVVLYGQFMMHGQRNINLYEVDCNWLGMWHCAREGNPEGRGPLGRPRTERNYNIKMDLEEIR